MNNSFIQSIVSKNQKLTFMDIWAPWELPEFGEDNLLYHGDTQRPDI